MGNVFNWEAKIPRTDHTEKKKDATAAAIVSTLWRVTTRSMNIAAVTANVMAVN